MAVEVEFKFDLKTIEHDAYTALEANLDLAMQDAATEIQRRTASGTDVSGSPFAPYAPMTKRIREESGRRTDIVNLIWSGLMMSAIQHRVTKQTTAIVGEIFFASATEAEKAKRNQERRDFFGLSDDQVEKIRARLVNGL